MTPSFLREGHLEANVWGAPRLPAPGAIKLFPPREGKIQLGGEGLDWCQISSLLGKIGKLQLMSKKMWKKTIMMSDKSNA